MFHLPHELQCLIFEFDSTYKEIFDKVLQSRFSIYKSPSKNLYFIFDCFTEKTYTTNSLSKPTFLCTTFTYLKRHRKHRLPEYHLETYKKKILKKYNVEKVNEKIEFDLENIEFTD